jgi:hypothetical protein
MPNEDQSWNWWWAAPVGFALVLVLLVLLFGQSQDLPLQGTSYDASAKGFRAAYLLLEELHYPVERSKRLAGEKVRWVLFPQGAGREARRLGDWILGGGTLLLADDAAEFARALGLDVAVHSRQGEPRRRPLRDAVTGEELRAAGGKPALFAGGATQVEWAGHKGRVCFRAGTEPVVTVYPYGQGRIWLVNRPDFLTNRGLRRADNAVILCRLAESMLREEGADRLAFDEFFHGLRDRPGVVVLLFRPPAVWVTLQGLLLLGLLLWRFVPRFGAVRPAAAAARRSQAEFLDALASLLERKGDYGEAFHTARDDLARELERTLGLPPGTPAAELAREAARRRPALEQRLLHLLTAPAWPAGAGPAAFVRALSELESTRDEFFHGHPRR